MPISVHPVDGLISRLLQQYHRTAGGSSSRTSMHVKPDHVSLSDMARQMTHASADPGKLESSLLHLYNQRGGV